MSPDRLSNLTIVVVEDHDDARRLANDLIALGGKKWIPWTMFLASLLIGLPLFFEVGFVLLVPLAFVISKRMNTPILRVGLPMLAGLSVAHALVPPHPAPTLAVATFHADAGKTILYAILVGIPTGILAGPVFANFAAGWIHSGSAPAPSSLARNPPQRRAAGPKHDQRLRQDPRFLPCSPRSSCRLPS